MSPMVPMIPRRVSSSIFGLALALAAGACDPADAVGGADVRQRPAPGGIKYDTAAIGGFNFSALRITGEGEAKATLRKICLDADDVALCLKKFFYVDGVMRASDGQEDHAVADLIGSVWRVDVDTPDPQTGVGDGVIDSEVPLHLVGRSIVDLPGGPQALVDLRVDLDGITGPLRDHLPPGGGLVPLCAPDPGRGGATEAALLGDLHLDPEDGSVKASPGTLRIACTSGATGRAVALGYHPQAIGLAGYEAVLRALRGDYCGDGGSFAAADDPFLLADVWGIRKTFGARREARWGNEGALCLGEARSDDADAAAIRGACGIPLCAAGPLGAAGEVLVTSMPK